METVEECAIRELQEETGLKAISWRLGPFTNDVIDSTKHYVTLFVIVDRFEGEPRVMEPDKCEGWQWFDPKQLPEPLFQPIQTLIRISPEAFFGLSS